MEAEPKPSALPSSCSSKRSEAAADSSRSSGGVVAASLIPHIGKLISLILQNGIRYEGFLHDIKEDSPCLGLRHVCVVGTEGGVSGLQDLSLEVFGYMLFQTSDIKHLQIKSPSLASPSYAHGSDSSINQSYHSSGGGVFPHLSLQELEYGLEKPSFQGQVFDNSRSYLPPLPSKFKEWCCQFESNAMLAKTSTSLAGPPPQEPVSYEEPELPLKEEATDMHLQIKSPSLASPSYAHGSDSSINQSYHSSGGGVFPHLNLQELEYGLEKPSFQGQGFHSSRSVPPPSPLNLTSKECNLFESNAAKTSPSLSGPPPQDPVSYEPVLPLKEEASRMKMSDQAHMTYQIGSHCFSDRPFSSFFYGEGFYKSVIDRSVPKSWNQTKRGCSKEYFTKASYSSISSASCHARNSSIGYRFLQFLKGFKAESTQNLYYKGLIVSMIYNNSTTMFVNFAHVMQYDSRLAAEICFFFESVRRELNAAARYFIMEFKPELEAFFSKKFDNFSELLVCIDGLPKPNRYMSLDCFANLPGLHFAEAKEICAGQSSMTVPESTVVGRKIASNILQFIFDNHSSRRTWNGQFGVKSIYLRNGSEVEIGVPFYTSFTRDAARNDLIRFVDDVISLFKVERLGLPAFFAHLGHYLKDTSSKLNYPDELHRFQKFAMFSLAFRGSVRRAALFGGVYRVRQTWHVKGVMLAILKSQSFK